MTDAEKTGEKQRRGRPFEAGRSGNPKGRPPGRRTAAAIIAERLLEDEARDVVQTVIDSAKNGDMVAARLVLERTVPVRKGRPVRFDLPPVESATGVMTALSAVLAAVAAGDLTTEEGQAIGALLESHRRAIETVEIEQRLAALEGRS